MAFIRPFAATMYRHESDQDISTLVAPPYDVIGPELRARLVARDPDNVVAVDLPEGSSDPMVPGNRYQSAGSIWRAWRSSGVLVDDHSDAFYVLEQTWEHAGRHVRRRAFVAAVELHDFSEGVVLPHERTLPKHVADRLDLTRACSANLSQVFALFSDPAGETDGFFDAAERGDLLVSARDAESVVSRVWAIRDAAMIAALQELLAAKQLFIADGHHRYTTALAYRDERRAADAAAGVSHAERPDYDFTMMALVNMDDPDLIVLPTHRTVRAEGRFDASAFWRELSRHFEVRQPPAGHPAAALASAPATSFLVKTADGTTRLATLRADVDVAAAIPGAASLAWKSLDATILQELVLGPIFGIIPDEMRTLERLTFVKDAHEALKLQNADAAFIMNATRMDQLRHVALGGETMPQKSTYFYPKLLSGLLFRTMR
ncbi:MAG: DUF1015 domain-containing protein [Actinomycetia bacterium]|nr:DUF1015 domain-containing protein [Actinomycetes bacterium]